MNSLCCKNAAYGKFLPEIPLYRLSGSLPVLLPVLGGQNLGHIPEGLRKFSLGLIAYPGRDRGDALVRLPQEPHGFPNPVFLHIGSNGKTVDGLEHLLERRGVDQILAGQLLNGKTAGQILSQLVVNLPDQFCLL